MTAAASHGVRWLLDLQNRDGGIPTFCRGWTGLPFDRSGADLTAHAVRAWLAWRPALPADRPAIDRGIAAATRHLHTAQQASGAFEPLWFGNEHTDGERNLTYGTAKVLLALQALTKAGAGDVQAAGARAAGWLTRAQHASGGWGGDAGATICSIEETARAVTALADSDSPGAGEAVERGVAWLRDATDDGRAFVASPIGLYFAKLWYSEQLYPVIFTVEALETVERVRQRRGRMVG